MAPLVVLATLATVIACRAAIWGAPSRMRRAVRTGPPPRLGILHISEGLEGQIHLPKIDAILAGGVTPVPVFGSPSNLASACGTAHAAGVSRLRIERDRQIRITDRVRSGMLGTNPALVFAMNPALPRDGPGASGVLMTSS